MFLNDMDNLHNNDDLVIYIFLYNIDREYWYKFYIIF